MTPAPVPPERAAEGRTRIITCEKDQQFHIGNDVVITITEIRGFSVKMAIGAPRSVPVHREEIYRRIQQALEAEQGKATGAREA
ncbi:carbon storage regulator [Pseudomonas solani]|uniref:Carbon storage regulator n=1 Tax=Pseudomonas solani TaxID=2731552 RepID=A0AAU7Y9R5_9PSED